ncbi:MAG: hypothetical protein IM526_12800 [Microcystis sp. M38BS1]|uniref:hypothetical protein n=1 Tax=Microcystis sp. M38BS1 TaxID=2771188 RepID=UPI0031FE0B09|nr:hypothetical protein [Microcystis sp. M38BS1]MCA6584460.1 hypothetical protein [Pseudanabaena sp. M34BS1SP1A06MG]
MTDYILVGAYKEMYEGLDCTGKYERDTYEYIYDKAQFKRVHFLLLDPENDYAKSVATLWHTTGMCGSGYTTATWGRFEVKTVDKFPFPPSHNCPPTKVELLTDFTCEDEYNWRQSLDFVIKLESGDLIAKVDYEGGDGYYPSGYYWWNESFFSASPRAVTRKKVYLFSGASGIGKTYLASHIGEGFEVYETDTSVELPDNLSDYDVVVLGNKYQFPNLVHTLSKNRDIVNVTFT